MLGPHQPPYPPPKARPKGPPPVWWDLLARDDARSHPYVVTSGEQDEPDAAGGPTVGNTGRVIDPCKVYLMNLQQNCDRLNLADFILDLTQCGTDGFT